MARRIIKKSESKKREDIIFSLLIVIMLALSAISIINIINISRIKITTTGEALGTVTLFVIVPLTVTLNSPADSSTDEDGSMIFSCSATTSQNLRNISLYTSSGGWHEDSTDFVNGTSNSTSFSKTLTDGTYTWNCRACDNSSCAFASSNYTLTVSIPSPPITITGGGGGGIEIKKDFSIEPEIMKVQLKVGSTLERTIKIKNTGQAKLTFNLTISPSLGFVSISEKNFEIEAGKEKEILVRFAPSQAQEPGAYVGSIIVNAGGIQKKILITAEIESLKVLFDVSLDIPAAYRKILPGGEVLMQVTIFNLADIGKGDVNVGYYAKDSEGNIIAQEKETVTIEAQASFSKRLKIPADAKEGDYVAVIQAKYADSVGTASEMFEVISKVPTINVLLILKLIIMTILLILIVLFIMQYRYIKLLKNIEKIQEKKLFRIYKEYRVKKVRGDAERKLRKQLSLLEKSFRMHFITPETYKKCKARIINLLSKVEEETPKKAGDRKI